MTNFYFWVGFVCKQSKEELKGVLHSAVLNTVWGYTSFGMGPQYFTLASVFDLKQVSYLRYESRIPVKHHRKLDVRHLEYLKTSPMRQYSLVNTFHT